MGMAALGAPGSGSITPNEWRALRRPSDVSRRRDIHGAVGGCLVRYRFVLSPATYVTEPSW